MSTGLCEGLVVSSGVGRAGVVEGIEVLRSGGSVLDAVERGAQVVEDDPAEDSVGYGGLPNMHGEVELDASIMEGSGRRCGAVGALRGYRHAISLARRVMELTPHCLIVGDGARELAINSGMQEENLLTECAQKTWREGLKEVLDSGGPVIDDLAFVQQLSSDSPHSAGTVNFIARDPDGRLAVGVSTSGWAWKHRGRLGDSPVVGAGNYCDDRYGACACTGLGELSIRAGTARAVVAAIAHGVGVEDACIEAAMDLKGLGGVDPGAIVMDILAVDSKGTVAAVSTRKECFYVFQTVSMVRPEVLPRVFVDLGHG